MHVYVNFSRLGFFKINFVIVSHLSTNEVGTCLVSFFFFFESGQVDGAICCRFNYPSVWFTYEEDLGICYKNFQAVLWWWSVTLYGMCLMAARAMEFQLYCSNWCFLFCLGNFILITFRNSSNKLSSVKQGSLTAWHLCYLLDWSEKMYCS